MSNITSLASKLSQLSIAWGASATEESSSSASELPTKSNSSLITATSGVGKAPSNNTSKLKDIAGEQLAGSPRASVATIKASTAKTTGSSKETQKPALTRHDTLVTAPVQGEGDEEVALDIGTYDGELEDDQRGSEVTGEAAEDLSLDSSILGSVAHCSAPWYTSDRSRRPGSAI